MSKLSLSDTFMDIMVKLAEGNPGALSVIMELYKQTTTIDPAAGLGELHYLLFLDDMDLYGDRIWILFKYICGSDLVKTIAVLRGWQLGHVSKITIKNAVETIRNHDTSGVRLQSVLDVDEILAKVKADLPDFGKAGN
jgi:hypothetical protein